MSLDVYFFFTGSDTVSSSANTINCPTLRCREIVELEFRGWDHTCGGDVAFCDWTVLDLVFNVSKTDGGEITVELRDVQDIPDEQKNQILNAAEDGADVLVEIAALADGSGYTVNCRNAFLNGTACRMEHVVAAKRRFLRSDILFVCLSGVCTCSYLLNFYYVWFLSVQGHHGVLSGKQSAALAVSFLANLGIAVGKLFWWNTHYDCDTRMCQKMVHNGVMTCTECVFDFALLYISAKVGVAMSQFSPCCNACSACNPIAHLLNHIIRIIGPLVTIAWLCWDTFQARLYAPGNNSLALVAVAFVLQALVFLSGLWCFYSTFFRRLCCPSDSDVKPEDALQGEAGLDATLAIDRRPET